MKYQQLSEYCKEKNITCSTCHDTIIEYCNYLMSLLDSAKEPVTNTAKGMDVVEIYRYQLEEIEDALRMIRNAFRSQNHKTCIDRQVDKCWHIARNVLSGDKETVVRHGIRILESESTHKISRKDKAIYYQPLADMLIKCEIEPKHLSQESMDEIIIASNEVQDKLKFLK